MQFDDYLWYLILRGKEKENNQTHPNAKLLSIFKGRNNNRLNYSFSNSVTEIRKKKSNYKCFLTHLLFDTIIIDKNQL